LGRRRKPAKMMIRKVPFLKGAFTPLVVPFRNGETDYERYAKLIEWQIEQGTHGLLVNATSGEPTTLTLEEKARLIEVAVKTSAGRRPVVASIPAESHSEAVMLLARANKAGADALISVTPYYVKPPQRGLSRSLPISPSAPNSHSSSIIFLDARRCRSRPKHSKRSPSVARISSG
jgi:hypothetical protein